MRNIISEEDSSVGAGHEADKDGHDGGGLEMHLGGRLLGMGEVLEVGREVGVVNVKANYELERVCCFLFAIEEMAAFIILSVLELLLLSMSM